MNTIIEFNNVWEKYRVKFVKDTDVSWEEVWALQDVNLKIEKGKILGIIGENGAGKTSLLKLIAGMLIPDKGTLNISGRVAALMELGAGFNPEFTGIENIKLNARMYGLSENGLEECLKKIVEFADIGKFIYAPVKYYSQGMYMRLAFALAIFVEPDILLIDDILAVGDKEAQAKCLKKINEFKQMGRTIILVSHDMNLVGSFCDRAVLLKQGKVIQDGPPEKAISSYIERETSKDGQALLKKERFNFIFNNGCMNLSCSDMLITKGNNSTFSFFVPKFNSWFCSSDLYWTTGTSSDSSVNAVGRSLDGNFKQAWNIKATEGNIVFRIETEGESAEKCFNFFVIPIYDKWFTLNEGGRFPPYMHRVNWQDIGLTSFPENFIGLCSAAKEHGFPVIIFEANDEESKIRLLNSGSELESRIIQVQTNKNALSIGTKIIFTEKDLEEYLKVKKDAFFLKQKAEEEKALLEQNAERKKSIPRRTVSSGKLSVFADAEGRLIRLYHNGKEITGPGMGISTPFPMISSQWGIKKISEEEMVVEIPRENMLEIWSLSCKQDTLQIKVELEITKPISLVQKFISLELIDEYANWNTAYESGEFLVNQYVNDMGPVRLKDDRVSEVAVKPKNNCNFTTLNFEAADDQNKKILGIFKKRNLYGESIYLTFSQNIPGSEHFVDQGRRLYFEGRIIFDKKEITPKERAASDVAEFSGKKLKLALERGIGRIYWQEKELTSGLGIFSSLRHNGIWHDSSRAEWKIIKKDKDRIIVFGEWINIPITQKWDIKLIDDSLVSWNVDVETLKEISLDISQVNIMLSSEFRHWMAPGSNQGDFADEYPEHYDILPFRFWYGQAKEIVSFGENLPRVIFKNNTDSDFTRAIIENSDYLYKSRLIQYQKTNSKKSNSGDHYYFNGAIKIENSP
ncbi:MAG: ABC transporter ATP-binding protein [Candidatus Omnitrophica bacterium]|nr:ABC transporter ATP-binding protein [Candidatus Omnitrophota bacterium]MDD5609942.1 ABC transporter ATP-binding protein [Candidatus Omnitrophota bacterium]